MQGLGNDFVFVDERDLQSAVVSTGSALGTPVYAQLAKRVCDRQFGIGADGLIVVGAPERTDCQLGWLYFNADGSSSAMCGNGLRCLGYWAVHYQYVSQREFRVDTRVGSVPVTVTDEDHITTLIGKPVLSSAGIPVGGPPRDRVLKERVELAGHKYDITCVSVGNPHCILFDSGLTREEAARRAPLIQADPFFPEGVNLEFVEVADKTHADVFVWERGCGPTLACASGAAAVLVAGVLEGRLERTAKIRLPGGLLTVTWDQFSDRVLITGPARISYEGYFDVALYMGEGGTQ